MAARRGKAGDDLRGTVGGWARGPRARSLLAMVATLMALSGVAEAVTNPFPQRRSLSAGEVRQIVRQAVAARRGRRSVTTRCSWRSSVSAGPKRSSPVAGVPGFFR